MTVSYAKTNPIAWYFSFSEGVSKSKLSATKSFFAVSMKRFVDIPALCTNKLKSSLRAACASLLVITLLFISTNFLCFLFLMTF